MKVNESCLTLCNAVDYTIRGILQVRILECTESDILECKVKWALGIITTNKASGGDGNQLSYLKS